MVPVYVEHIGVEAYGVIGAFAVLQGFATIFDFGLTITINQKLASAGSSDLRYSRDLVRTLELVFWALAIIVALALFACSHAISKNLFRDSMLAAESQQRSITFLTLGLAAAWPTSFYSAALYGLSGHSLMARLNFVITPFRALSTLAALKIIEPSLEIFSLVQLAAGSANTAILCCLVWHRLGKPLSGRFAPAIIRQIRGFATGLSLSGILGVVLLQLDKIVIARYMSLETLGYYSLAVAVSGTLLRLATPVYTAISPRMSNLVSRNDAHGAGKLYKYSSFVMALLILPPTVMFTVLPTHFLAVWTGNLETAERLSVLTSVLLVGVSVQALGYVAWAVQLAHGNTRLSLVLNLASLIVQAPLLVLVAQTGDAVIVALIWMVCNIVYILASLHTTDVKYFGGHMRKSCGKWYLLPVAVTLMVGIIARQFVDPTSTRLTLLAILGGLMVIVYALLILFNGINVRTFWNSNEVGE
jgi:O-antigen/teichoic acid export membrane protein